MYLEALTDNPDIIELWLGGSRGKGPKNPTAHSDYDVQLVTGTNFKKSDLPTPKPHKLDLFFFEQGSKHAILIYRQS